MEIPLQQPLEQTNTALSGPVEVRASRLVSPLPGKDPASMSGLICNLDPSRLDLLDGAAVTSWLDATGTYTFTTGGTGPTFVASAPDLGDRSALHFHNTPLYNSAISYPGQNHTIIAVVWNLGGSGTATMWGGAVNGYVNMNTGVLTTFDQSFDSQSPPIMFGNPGFNGSTVARGGSSAATGQWPEAQVCMVAAGAANNTVWVNGRSGTTPAYPNNTYPNLRIGASGDGLYPFHGLVGQILVFNRQLNATEQGQAIRFLMAKFRVRPAMGDEEWLIVGDGDSIARGAYLTYERQTWPAQLAGMLGRKSFHIKNAGVSGAALTGSARNWVADPYLTPGRRSVIVVAGGINNVVNSGIAAAQTQALSYYTSLKTLGYTYVVACTLTDTNGYGSRADITTFNNYILNNQGTLGWDAVADNGNLPRVGLPGSAPAGSNAYYYDNVHLSEVGNRMVANNVFNTIRLLLRKQLAAKDFVFEYGTTDNAAKTVKTIFLDSGTIYSLRLRVTAVRIDTGTEDGYFELQREIRGAATAVVNTPTGWTDIAYRNTLTTAAPAIVVSGANVNLQVTGEPGKTLAWCCSFELTQSGTI
jgi:hypothetical protein